MKIKSATGMELEKEKPNTSEDFFNRSSVVYTDKGIEKEFHVLYVRFFDEQLQTFTPYDADPIFTVGEKEVTLKDTVALVSLLKNRGNAEKKRIYINEIVQFKELYERVNFSVLEGIYLELLEKGEFDRAEETGLFHT